MNDTQRATPWGTITCGVLAVITAVLVGLVQLGGVAIPFRTLGPGAIIGAGVLVLLAGLFIVLRSNAKEHKARMTAPVPPVADRPVLGQRDPASLDQPSALGATIASMPTSTIPASSQPTSTLDVDAPTAAESVTSEIPAAQGAAEGPSPEGHGEAQSNH